MADNVLLILYLKKDCEQEKSFIIMRLNWLQIARWANWCNELLDFVRITLTYLIGEKTAYQGTQWCHLDVPYLMKRKSSTIEKSYWFI